MNERKVCFSIDEATHKQVKALPRSFNLSDELRKALTIIITNESKHVKE